MKKNLVVSFSGGETSAYMLWWLWNNKRDEYSIRVVFANTGEENEETLIFVEKVSKWIGVDVEWIEAVTNKGRKGTGYKVVDFVSASRKGEPFEGVISKYGIPNQAFPHCTRELKEVPLGKWAKDIFGKKWYTAIGIRSDESDRISSKARERGFIYPLVGLGVTKNMVNKFWDRQDFRLELKGYQGNCKWCWKKGYPKLWRIARENPEKFDFPNDMEEKYGNYTPESRTESNPPYTFFRGNKSAKEILFEAPYMKKKFREDSLARDEYVQLDMFDLVGGESCEVFSSCGDS